MDFSVTLTICILNAAGINSSRLQNKGKAKNREVVAKKVDYPND